MDLRRSRANLLSFPIVDDAPCYIVKRLISYAERSLAPVLGDNNLIFGRPSLTIFYYYDEYTIVLHNMMYNV